MGLKSPRLILVLESLDGGRRTDAKRGDKTERIAGRLGHHHQSCADKERDGSIHRTTQNSSVGHGADRTLVAGKLGIISVNVDGLDDAYKGDQKDTQQR